MFGTPHTAETEKPGIHMCLCVLMCGCVCVDVCVCVCHQVIVYHPACIMPSEVQDQLQKMTSNFMVKATGM